MKPPIDILPLFPVLNDQLLSFLKDLPAEGWHAQTVAREWKVKDVAAHLLDGNFRRIAVHRDGWTVSVADPIQTYDDLVRYLNRMNEDWVKAIRRLSPAIIIELLESTNEEVYNIFKGLDPFAESVYPVSWAGENRSFNWFDIAREYTERWLHQQQIREAMNNRDIMTQQLYHPFLDIFMRGWPLAMNVAAEEGTILKTAITGEGGGVWYLKMGPSTRSGGKWEVENGGAHDYVAETIINGDVAWKLFSKSVRKQDINGDYQVKGNQLLGEKVLDMISVMA